MINSKAQRHRGTEAQSYDQENRRWKIEKRRITFFSVLCLLFSVNLLQAAEVTMGLDKTSVALGDSVTMGITVKGTSNPTPPQIPPIPGFNVRFVGTVQEPYSSVTTIINGKVQTQTSGGGFVFQYALFPEKTGILTISPFAVNVAGQTYQTSPYQIEVVDRSQQSGDVFVKLTANKRSVYLGERALVTFKWYFNKNINGYECSVPWMESAKNFLVTEPERDQGKQYQEFVVNGNQQIAAIKGTEDYKGKRYAVISFQRVLAPMASGNQKLEPAFLKCEVVKGYNRKHGPFDDFFDHDFDEFFKNFGGGGFGGGAITESFSTRSNALDIQVKPLPASGRPSSFGGAVGNFNFQVTVNPSRVKAGDPVTVSMKIRGKGNLDEIKMLPFPELGAFQGYEPEVRTDVKQIGADTTGEKVFNKTLIPRAKGTYNIPAISFSYFNPESESYKTIALGPFPVEVEKGLVTQEPVSPQALSTVPSGTDEKPEIKFIEKDINYIKTDMGTPDRVQNEVYHSTAFWTIGFIPPPILALACFVFQKRKNKLETDVGYVRHRQASRIAKKRLKLCEKLLRDKQPKDFYEEVSRALNSYLADKLNRSSAGITGDIVAELEKKGVAPEVLKNLKDCYETADMAKFSGLDFGDPQMTETFEKVNKLIRNLEEVL